METSFSGRCLYCSQCLALLRSQLAFRQRSAIPAYFPPRSLQAKFTNAVAHTLFSFYVYTTIEWLIFFIHHNVSQYQCPD